jgi:hypothetical protein
MAIRAPRERGILNSRPKMEILCIGVMGLSLSAVMLKILYPLS